MLNKSPSGSLCPYYYMGGELHPLKYGSYFDDKEKLFAVIDAEEAFILKSTGTKNRRIWIDLYETTIDDFVATKLVEHIVKIEHKIFKLCLVGCSLKDKNRIKKLMKNRKLSIFNAVRYFSDPEEAKLWLVSENIK
ncbi:MAG: hypothetical protein A2Y17_09535 [Clostridiales bacterium GWF2_38_85]|nr:MAG: hypothetical protein A2Y17_09535 [Clostridiales bacterium GWF2_38_85]HBL83561.1 hypothetical protein [Clostridiales bacterium]